MPTRPTATAEAHAMVCIWWVPTTTAPKARSCCLSNLMCFCWRYVVIHQAEVDVAKWKCSHPRHLSAEINGYVVSSPLPMFVLFHISHKSCFTHTHAYKHLTSWNPQARKEGTSLVLSLRCL